MEQTSNSPLLAAREGPAPPWQIPILVHAFCCVLGFALCLPCGAILARYLRTVRPWWYTGHWIILLGAALFIMPGVVLGYLAAHQLGETPSNNHKACWIRCTIAAYLLTPR
ncbi:hypothetical protein B0H19DRAFT_1072709 [Mycena capillaripes]|nr:hypothetical protein B0H19DRAFT_1072709 [Mycena capillaripes]